MFHLVSLAGVLYALWLLLSGFLHEPLLLGLGVISVGAVVFIAHRMDVVDHEGHPIHLSHRFGVYLPWLLWEIVKSNILGLTIYANSITLTPGTVTLGIDDNVLSVHALTVEAAEGVAAGDMDRRVSALEA
ncbi:MAG: Na+/H+ antiporter subunit E [Rhodospirillales bacterium]|nr:Na+/H+ antiporter subunit E [Rhodospirillales bacterium]